MSMLRGTFLALCFTVAVGYAAEAQADYWYAGGYPWWFGGPFSTSAYQSGRIPTPPYFAIHPPVYYGQRVGMPYGNSPYTRPPRPAVEITYVSPPTVAVPNRIIENPFVSQREPTHGQQRTPKPRRRPERVQKPVATQPRIILNPYVQHDGSTTFASYEAAIKD